MRLVLTHWQLHADTLPDELLDGFAPRGFTLPGAKGLDAFAELLGGETPDAPEADDRDSAPFALPAMIPQDARGPVCLTRAVDFGALRGDAAWLEIDHILGGGEILLDDAVIARFGGAPQEDALLRAQPCMLCADLTDALHLGRRAEITLRFDETRPAGVCGPVTLRTAAHARLERAALLPDARRRTMSVRAQVAAMRAGRYVLRAQFVPAAGKSAPPAREVSLTLSAGETQEARLGMEVGAPAFVPGQPYAHAAMKLQLFFRPEDGRHEGALCDDALLLCGYPQPGAAAYVPLAPDDLSGDPRALADALAALHIPAVYLPAPADDLTMRALCRAGVAAAMCLPPDSPLRAQAARYPNAVLLPLAPQVVSPAATAWQLCASVAYPRAADDSLTEQEMLLDAAGRALDPDEAHVRDVLSWLSALSVRLRAEAARQGRYAGALCGEGMLACADVQDALRTAFAPLHLSALPLSGAWWTGARFSATIEAFFPAGEGRALTASAALEDEDGHVLARLSQPCARSGPVGVLEAPLPDHSCVLTLCCALLDGENVIEESAFPVYVGENGPLEAAF